MPYRFPDLTSGGKHLLITNPAHLTSSAVIANSESATCHIGSNPTAPGVYFIDPTGYYAPVWGSADESFTVMVAWNLTAGTTNQLLLSYGDPSDTVHGWNILINSLEGLVCQVHDTAAGVYLSSTMTGIIGAGSHIAHCEFQTGLTRAINIWVDNVSQAVTIAGPTGSPFVVTGNERLTPINYYTGAAGNGNTLDPISKIGFWKRKLTNVERDAQYIALNAA